MTWYYLLAFYLITSSSMALDSPPISNSHRLNLTSEFLRSENSTLITNFSLDSFSKLAEMRLGNNADNPKTVEMNKNHSGTVYNGPHCIIIYEVIQGKSKIKCRNLSDQPYATMIPIPMVTSKMAFVNNNISVTKSPWDLSSTLANKIESPKLSNKSSIHAIPTTTNSYLTNATYEITLKSIFNFTTIEPGVENYTISSLSEAQSIKKLQNQTYTNGYNNSYVKMNSINSSGNHLGDLENIIPHVIQKDTTSAPSPISVSIFHSFSTIKYNRFSTTPFLHIVTNETDKLVDPSHWIRTITRRTQEDTNLGITGLQLRMEPLFNDLYTLAILLSQVRRQVVNDLNNPSRVKIQPRTGLPNASRIKKQALKSSQMLPENNYKGNASTTIVDIYFTRMDQKPVIIYDYYVSQNGAILDPHMITHIINKHITKKQAGQILGREVITLSQPYYLPNHPLSKNFETADKRVKIFVLFGKTRSYTRSERGRIAGFIIGIFILTLFVAFMTLFLFAGCIEKHRRRQRANSPPRLAPPVVVISKPSTSITREVQQSESGQRVGVSKTTQVDYSISPIASPNPIIDITKNTPLPDVAGTSKMEGPKQISLDLSHANHKISYTKHPDDSNAFEMNTVPLGKDSPEHLISTASCEALRKDLYAVIDDAMTILFSFVNKRERELKNFMNTYTPAANFNKVFPATPNNLESQADQSVEQNVESIMHYSSGSFGRNKVFIQRSPEIPVVKPAANLAMGKRSLQDYTGMRINKVSPVLLSLSAGSVHSEDSSSPGAIKESVLIQATSHGSPTSQKAPWNATFAKSVLGLDSKNTSKSLQRQNRIDEDVTSIVNENEETSFVTRKYSKQQQNEEPLNELMKNPLTTSNQDGHKLQNSDSQNSSAKSLHSINTAGSSHSSKKLKKSLINGNNKMGAINNVIHEGHSKKFTPSNSEDSSKYEIGQTSKPLSSMNATNVFEHSKATNERQTSEIGNNNERRDTTTFESGKENHINKGSQEFNKNEDISTREDNKRESDKDSFWENESDHFSPQISPGSSNSSLNSLLPVLPPLPESTTKTKKISKPREEINNHHASKSKTSEKVEKEDEKIMQQKGRRSLLSLLSTSSLSTLHGGTESDGPQTNEDDDETRKMMVKLDELRKSKEHVFESNDLEAIKLHDNKKAEVTNESSPMARRKSANNVYDINDNMERVLGSRTSLPQMNHLYQRNDEMPNNFDQMRNNNKLLHSIDETIEADD